MTRSQFLQLAGMSAFGFASRAHAFPEGYTGIPRGIRPYLQTPRPDSMWVSWFSDDALNGQVEWGSSPNDLNRSAEAALDVLEPGQNYHSVQITGLEPDTFYHYRVSNGATLSEVFRFRTPPPLGNTARLRVLVMGDNQIFYENRYERLIACAKAKIEADHGVPIEEAVNFILMPGDMVDAGSPRYYRHLHFRQCGLISPNVPIMTTVGNHETYGDESLSLYSRIFNYSDINYAGVTSPGGDKYYSYQVGAVAFLHTCSDLPGTQQEQWARRFVDALKTDISTSLCVSVTHRPYQAETMVGDISGWFRGSVMPMLAETEKHVLNIGAHHHLYARGQTREWPIYHIISGGTAWDHFWGQATEMDMDDVQKTVANWAWQLLEFDPAARTMHVSCYAEANVRLPAATRWNYNSRLIDSFHRRLGLPSPGRPSLGNPGTAPVTLPLTLATGVFQAGAAGETLNSVWFQIAANAQFLTPSLDRIRDVENLHGDTGAPLYEPVDRHAGLDITRLTIPAQGLADGVWFARARHRDTNAQWSEWSETVRFQITGEGKPNPSLSLAHTVIPPGEALSLTFANAPGAKSDWIGIYRKNDNPATTPREIWAYLNGTRTAPAASVAGGTLQFPDIPGEIGQEWFAAFFAAGGHNEVAPRVRFLVGAPAGLTISAQAFVEGASVRVGYSAAPVGTGDNIGIFHAPSSPGAAGVEFARIGVAGTEGSRDFPAIPKGYYYAVYLYRDGDLEISARLWFSIGAFVSTVDMAASDVPQGKAFALRFRGAPGMPKDWVGLYKKGQIPGVDAQTASLYAGGKTEGSVTFQAANLTPGEYFAVLFINDSNTEVSPRFAFTVTPVEHLEFTETSLNGNQFRMRWNSTPGRAYVIQKNNGLSGDWVDVRTVIPPAATHEEILTVNRAAEPRAFFRLARP